MTKTFTFRTDDELQAIIDREGEMHGSLTDGIKDLVADGLRYRMMVNTPPIAAAFLAPLTPDGVIRAYVEFLEAIRGKAGLVQNPRYRFCQVPAGGRWEQKGLAGAWAVLPTNIGFTLNGKEIIEPLNGEDHQK